MKKADGTPIVGHEELAALRLDVDRDFQALRNASGRLLLGLFSAGLLVALFAWLSEEVFEGDMTQFDLRIRAAVHSYSNPRLTSVMQSLTFLGSVGFVAILFVSLVVLLLAAKMKRDAIWLSVSLFGATALDLALKLVFHRPRPIPFFGPVLNSYSFPSGHAMTSFCFYGVIAGLLCERIRSVTVRAAIWVAAALLVAGIGLSRIYLGMHYPTDVIAGYLGAAIWVSTLLLAAHFCRPRSQPN